MIVVHKVKNMNGNNILLGSGMKFRNEKKFRYGIPAYTGGTDIFIKNSLFYFQCYMKCAMGMMMAVSFLN
jgi:hypothetical protein